MRRWLINKRLWLLISCVIGAVLLLNLPHPVDAEPGALQPTPTMSPLFDGGLAPSSQEVAPLGWSGFWHTLAEIAPIMLLAALLGGLVAYRRRVTVFEHNLFHAHILLSVSGALMMLIVGNQLVRAFGLLGAASVVRYRYGLRNPRDASLLIIALGVGMATGVRLYALAVSAAAVVFVFSRGLDFFGARFNLLLVVTQPTRLRVRTLRPDETMATIHQVFARRGIPYRLRSYRRIRKKKVAGTAVFALDYTVQLGPQDGRERLTSEITAAAVVSVRWKTQRPRKG